MISREDILPRPLLSQPHEDHVSPWLHMSLQYHSLGLLAVNLVTRSLCGKKQPEVGDLQAKVQIFSLSLGNCTKEFTNTK